MYFIGTIRLCQTPYGAFDTIIHLFDGYSYIIKLIVPSTPSSSLRLASVGTQLLDKCSLQ